MRRRNPAMRAAGRGYLIFFALFVLPKLILPRGQGGWSVPPVFDLLAILGWGACTLVMAGCYLYHSWSKNTSDYIDWFLEQAGSGAQWQRDMVSSLPVLTLWQARIFSPLGVILGAAMMAFAVYSLLFGLPPM